MIFPRHQPPVYSPIPSGILWGAMAGAARPSADARPALRERLRREFHAPGVVLSGSGTAALELALRAALRRRGPDSLVALPCFSCFDVATAAVGAGCRVAFYDLDPESLAPDLESLRRALERGAGVVVVSYLYGVPVDWEALERCARPFAAILVEDAAQGHGASWRGRPLGSLGPLSVVSFGRGKGWTGGGGGALLARAGEMLADPDPSLEEPHGMAVEGGALARTAAHWALGRPSLYGIPRMLPFLRLGETRYRDPEPPTGMSRSCASLLEGSFAAAGEEAARRRGIAASLIRQIPRGIHLRPLRAAPGGTPGYLRLPLRLSRGMAGFRSPRRAMRLGVMPSYPRLLPELPQLRHRSEGGDDERWPGGATLVRELVTLPSHSLLTSTEHTELLDLLHRYWPMRGRDPERPRRPVGARALPDTFLPARQPSTPAGDR